MHAYFGGGKGTNTKVEIIALWGLLWLARKLKLDNLQVLGDSKVITSWASEWLIYRC
jgi:ribonuclease HI